MLPNSERNGIGGRPSMRSTTNNELTCRRCGLGLPYSGDWYGDLCPQCADETESPMCFRQFKLKVPTYNASYFPEQVATNQMEEFGEPELPVLIHEAGGVRVVLGTHDYDDMGKPDIQIERQPNGWVIFLHPLGGSDASGYIYFLDDGRSFLAKEHPYGPTPTIEILEPGEELEEIDGSESDESVPEDAIEVDKPVHLDSLFPPNARASWRR
jgi:hypothetical protein